jgi:hypothetical protein
LSSTTSWKLWDLKPLFLYSNVYTIKIKLQIIRQAEYGEPIEEIRNNYELSVWRPEGSRIIWRPSIDKWMKLKYAFKKQIMKNEFKSYGHIVV